MSFILLGKHSDDLVILLSEEVYVSRKDATDALSGLTSDPSFPHWDAEVFVVDIDKATPVLLVRPAVAPAADEAEAETEVVGAVDEEAIQHAGSDVGEPDEDTESLVVEENAFEPEAEEVSGDVDLSAALTELGIGEEELAPPEADASEDAEEGSELRDAIARTAAQMAAAGIVPPESVGPEAQEEDAEQPAEAAAEEAPSLEEAGEPDESADIPELGDEVGPEAGGEPLPEDAQSWPWASGEPEEADGSFSLSALEEPGVDEGSLVKAAGDDETMDFARPVILGDYDDIPAAEPMSVAMADAVAAQAEEATEDTGSSEELAAALAAAMAETGAVSESPAPEEESPAEASSAAASPADGLTCEDCVYFQTCPNKEDREPSSCGSFQWK